MRAEHAWIEPDAAGPVAKETRILSGREALLWVTLRGKRGIVLASRLPRGGIHRQLAGFVL